MAVSGLVSSWASFLRSRRRPFFLGDADCGPAGCDESRNVLAAPRFFRTARARLPIAGDGPVTDVRPNENGSRKKAARPPSSGSLSGSTATNYLFLSSLNFLRHAGLPNFGRRPFLEPLARFTRRRETRFADAPLRRRRTPARPGGKSANLDAGVI